jgi:RNA polymerase sigma-54 factor
LRDLSLFSTDDYPSRSCNTSGNKYLLFFIQTPRGTLELKSFFSVGVKQSNGSDPTSAASIRHRIRKLIDSESPNAPISDERIVDTLSRDGIDVARRTVSKYRKLDNIPSSFARKRRNILEGFTR